MFDVNEYIRSALEDIDIEHMVRQEIRKEISGDIKRQISTVVRTKIDEIITTEIDIFFSAPIETNDGYGKKKAWPSFEDMFKQGFKRKMESSYDVKRSIEKQSRIKYRNYSK